MTTMLGAATATAATLRSEELADMSLEQLSRVQITSVSGHAEPLLDAAASIFVITNDDIRRSGATTLPEVLRLAPNLDVAQMSTHSYVVSARGLNGAGNKLLVLIDGRIVYTPLYSGVLWHAQDVLLEDVDRIEVISGPGGTQWGTNAVNGVINVITRNAAATTGGMISGGGGDRERRSALRYGGSFEGGAYRVYAKASDIDDTRTQSGASRNDDLKRAQLGFRIDWSNGITVQGDAYRGSLGHVEPGDGRFSGANLLLRWNHRLSGGDVVELQAYVDQTEVELTGAAGEGRLSQRLNIADIEFQHRLREHHGHSLSWGVGYRMARDHLVNLVSIAFLPARLDLAWSNLFVQDQYRISPDLTLTGGVRFEKNSYTDVETLPSLRLAWTPQANQLVWGAVSRAVRSPSRLDRDLYSPGVPPFQIAGGPGFRSEIVNVIELGYRAQPMPAVSYSVTAFFNDYDRLRSVEFVEGSRFEVANKMRGTAHGLEAWGSWQVNGQWLLHAGAAWLDQRLEMEEDSTDMTGISAAGNDPELRWTLRSSWNLPHDTELDIGVRHVSRLPDPAVPAYTAVDVRLGWRPRPGLEISLVGMNLFDDGHIESGAPASASVIPRSVFLNLRWDI